MFSSRPKGRKTAACVTLERRAIRRSYGDTDSDMQNHIPPTNELIAWLRLSQEPDLGAAQARNLLAACGLPQDIYAMSVPALSRLLPEPLARQLRQAPDETQQKQIDAALAWLEQPGHHLLTLADPAYPQKLLDIHDPPLVLYVNGDVSLLNRPALGIVGSRNPTAGGADNASAFARHLASQGWCIVSGLALGIDAAAHRGALQAGDAGGRTVAVMGTGIDIVYPASHRELAHQIAASGALVSEFPLGMRSLPHHFPKRNRIVAGLSQGVLVVEAARQSGSLITARLAGESGREVFAIPGSIHSPLSRGCHALIRQGAKLVESADDILEDLGNLVPDGPKPAAGPAKPASSRKSKISRPEPEHPDSRRVLDAMGYDPVDADTLLVRTGMDIAALSQHLLELEMQDCIVRQDDGRFVRR